MERLTFKTTQGVGVYKIGKYSGETIMPSDIRKKVPECAESIINALNKLAACEDAGLTPEEAKKWKKSIDEFNESLNEIKNEEFVPDEKSESDTCEQYCGDCPHRIYGKKQRTKPEPLTLEQLLKRGKQPIWVVPLDSEKPRWYQLSKHGLSVKDFNLILGVIGGGIYYGVELLWRGHSYFSMIIVGGICFILIGLLNQFHEWEMALISQMFISSFIITGVELSAGLILNVWLNLDIWDYSNMPMNFMGQICMTYFGLWQFLSVVAILLDDYVRYWFFGEEKPRYKLR